MLAVLALLLGVALVAGGIALSPVPWLALVWLGVAAIAAGLLVDVSERA
jgi:4-hydroxybenzoate polyprenyltransferase